MSFFPRPLFLTLALLLMACGSGGSGSGSSSDGGGDGGGGGDSEATAAVLIRWQATPSAEGYVVYWGTSSGTYVHNLDVGTQEPSEDDGVVSFLLDGVARAETIYIVVTSYDSSGAMSRFSNELSAFVP